MSNRRLSIVIPTLNERGNIDPLVERLSRALEESGVIWEAIFIDDHSTDGTYQMLERIAKKGFPITSFLKAGKRGKAHSLLEGFAKAKYEYIAILDADLQYPPEALPGMVEKLYSGHTDIVVANRSTQETTVLRRVLSRVFKAVFSQFLHGLDCDVQSGLKVFRRKILHDVKLDPTPWTFDLEFLLAARNYGYVIGTVDIAFAERTDGASKIHFLKAIWEIGWNALALRFKGRPPLLISPGSEGTMLGAGIAHNRKRFITHTTLHHRYSALHTFAPWQRNFGLFVIAAILVGLFVDPLLTGIVIIAVLSSIYFIDVFFNLGLVLKSLKTPPEIESTEAELRAVPDEGLPIYSILCPLYKEAHMLPGFVAAIEKLHWPHEKLDVLLLLEENDPETVKAAEAMKLPAYVRIIIVPHSEPKTKPKACNYGLSLARGEYMVIYDAEDIPDPWQLRKAYLGFKKSGPEVKCLQAKLNYFNPEDNLLTRFFTAEYSLWFDIILVGLQSINTSIPLGGTSNHFRTKDLIELEGWDPFNVTEDCDLGVRIFKRGARTAIIDSVTLEEANGHTRNWLRQRSRWIKGYMQTYLVHMRHPANFVRENGIHALLFQLTVGAKLSFLFINPILWLTTIAYFTLYAYVGPTIEALYPSWIFYMAAISLVFGNFFYLYYYMVGCAKRHHWPLIKYVFLVPLYWILGSTAAYIALYELLVKPHYWQKTVHGLSAAKAEARAARIHLPSVWRKAFDPARAAVWGPVSRGLLRLRQLFPDLKPQPFLSTLSARWKFSVRALPRLLNGLRAFFRTLALGTGNRVLRDPNHFWQSIFRRSAPLFSREKQENEKKPKAALTRNASAALPDGMTGYATVRRPGLLQGLAESVTRLVPKSIKSFIFSGQGFLVAAFIFGNFLNFLFNAFLGRTLSFAELSLVTLINTLWYVATIFTSAFGSTVNHRTAYLLARKGRVSANRFFSSALRRTAVAVFSISFLWFVSASFIASFFQITDTTLLLFFAPALFFGFVSYAFQGYFQGSLRFAAVGIICLTEAVSKLLVAGVLVSLGQSARAYLSVPIALVISGSLAWFMASQANVPEAETEAAPFDRSFPKKFLLFSILASTSAILFLSVDVLLVKHFFDEELAGQYALLSLVGKMIYFFASLPCIFMITYVSRREGRRESTLPVLHLIYLLVLALVAAGVFALGFLSPLMVPFLLGPKAEAIIMWLPLYTVGIGFFTLGNVLVLYHLAKHHYLFSIASLLASLSIGIGIWNFHASIAEVTLVVFFVSLGSFTLYTLLHLLEGTLPFLARGYQDFIGAFVSALPKTTPVVSTGKRILIFNWRDLTHAYAGGAEVYVHEIAKEWARLGHHVTIFAGNDGSQKRYQTIDGVQIIRRGGFFLVYVWAAVYYLLRLRNKYDVIIDCENGIPFFTPLYARQPIFCLMHHVHQDVFFHSLSKPLAWLASFLEKTVMPIVYRDQKFITVSESSKEEMNEHGIGQAGIFIVHPGINKEEFEPILVEKTLSPTILYLGRLKAYKSINVLIQAFRVVLSERPDARLVIAGSGDEETHLKRLAKELRLTSEQIQFVGQVSQTEKVRLLQSSWMLVNPSFMEGWGIVAIEANACGTPVIASDVPGLRDSVRDGQAGYLLPYGDVAAFSDSILQIIRNRELRLQMGDNARAWADNFSWERASTAFLSVISRV